MGGNALKELSPKRMTTRTVVNLFNHIQRQWLMRRGAQALYLVPWIEEKDDHGDIDIIADTDVGALVDWLRQQQVTWKTNDTVVSAAWPDGDGVVQVDFICAAGKGITPLRFFYSGGDFGMLLGRLAAWYGFAFGMDGLRLRADSSKPWSKDILLTASPDAILQYLRLPLLPRFTTYEVMWSYVLSSPMARSYMFMPEGTNAENRSRDKQRPKIKAFQEWLRDNHPWPKGRPYDVSRVTFDEALLREVDRDPRIGVMVGAQEKIWNDQKAFAVAVGLGPVEAMAAEPLDKKTMGEVVRRMQPALPEKAWLSRVYATSPETVDTIARTAAAMAMLQMGIKIKT